MGTFTRVAGTALLALATAWPAASAQAAGVPGAAPTVVAAAATSSSTVSRSFSSSARVWSKRFDLCVWMTFKGRLSATRYRYVGEGPYWIIDLKKPRIADPRIIVTFRRTCKDGAALKSRHRANTVHYAGYVYGYKCDYDPSFSVSAPWGVSVGVTPDCGDERVAGYGDTQRRTRRANTFRLRTDGVAVRWDGRDWVQEGYGTARICTSISGYFVLRDTVGTTRDKQVIKAALRDRCVSTS